MLLSFWPSTAPPTPLPHHISRSFIDSPGGLLELLSAIPQEATAKRRPLFFVHGGFGAASVWLEYMTFLSAAPYHIPCYAISLRGHGASWRPGYISMTFFTTKRMLADDIAVGVRHIEQSLKQQGDGASRVMLAAHSNGGALAQVALNDGDFQVGGLVLVDAASPSGILLVYWNWLKADPWFPLRVYSHLMHPRSPLSSTYLVKNAFFSDAYPTDKVKEFETRMSPYESLIWPLACMFRFASITKILENVTLLPDRPSVLVIAGEKSRLMGVKMMAHMAVEYAMGAAELLGRREKDTVTGEQIAQVVRYQEVRGAGHHVQNDLNWEEGARALASFHEDATRA